MSLNDRQRKFCELVVSGTPAGRAYEQAGFKAKGASADTGAHELLKRDDVKGYLAELRGEAKEAAGMSRDQAIQFCVDVLRSKPSEASMDNPLCEVKMSKAGPFAAFPDKARMLERLSRMVGFDEPDKFKGELEIKVTIGGDA